VLRCFCDCDGCEYRAKANSQITQHKANKSNIGVKWKQCAHCDYKAKTNGNLTLHKTMKPNIGV